MIPGEYDCCRHCETSGRFDPHVLDPPPHAKPCAEGCNDPDQEGPARDE